MAYQVVINDAGVIEAQALNPQETFINSDGSDLGGKTILDYWKWAFSDLVSNTERGVLAEYMVAMAVGSERPVRGSWEPYDIEAPDGTKIEVKSASYVQSWYQKELSKIQFSIRKTLEWIESGNISDGILRDYAGTILLFEAISFGEGSGTSYPHNHQLPWTRGWFIYDDTEELNNIIDREFTEF